MVPTSLCWQRLSWGCASAQNIELWQQRRDETYWRRRAGRRCRDNEECPARYGRAGPRASAAGCRRVIAGVQDLLPNRQLGRWRRRLCDRESDSARCGRGQCTVRRLQRPATRFRYVVSQLQGGLALMQRLAATPRPRDLVDDGKQARAHIGQGSCAQPSVVGSVRVGLRQRERCLAQIEASETS